MTKIALFFCPPIKIKHCKSVHTARGEVVMLHVIAKFIAITKEEGMKEEKNEVVFWSTKSLAKKVSFFIGPESDHWECLSVTHSLTN